MTLLELKHQIDDIQGRYTELREKECRKAVSAYKRSLPFHKGDTISYGDTSGVITKVIIKYYYGIPTMDLVLKGDVWIHNANPDKVIKHID